MFAERSIDLKIAALQESVKTEMETQISSLREEIHSIKLGNSGAAQSSSGLGGAQIFEMAKEQVVGITTEVTYQNFFGMSSSSAVSGSGFVISEDGYILTNYHVIETAYSNNLDITVMTYDGTKYTAAIVGFESGNDIAVLKIDATGLSPVAFGNSDEITMGETVYAVGNPLGELAYSMSTGTVSGLDREIVTDESVVGINMFQIDAAVNPGNSGGPVYNGHGEVIGIVTAKSGATNAEGLGFAIPSNDASSIADDLMTKGYVTGKAYMGVRLDERYNAMYAEYYNMPLGAYVYSVDNGSAAERAGLQAGDIITKLGDTEISSYTDLKAAVRAFSAGDSVDIVLFRAGESIVVSITFDEARPAGIVESSNEVLDPYSSEQN
ncbi:MAG: trypsin-like peptidase domain-containing protein [Oscillospiraceae bacterium]|nr:trypsin-like peptidase domain-containing protein [Oscillospiraceae bacterium]